MTFKMKQHTLALFLAAGGIAILLGCSSTVLLSSDWTIQETLLAWFVAALCIGLLFVSYPQRIVVLDGIVTVRSGLWTMRRFRLSDVQRVYTSKGWPFSHTLHPVTGWRCSVGKKQILVIPADELAFLEEVARQAPHLRRYGNELGGGVA